MAFSLNIRFLFDLFNQILSLIYYYHIIELITFVNIAIQQITWTEKSWQLVVIFADLTPENYRGGDVNKQAYRFVLLRGR